MSRLARRSQASWPWKRVVASGSGWISGCCHKCYSSTVKLHRQGSIDQLVLKILKEINSSIALQGHALRG